MAVKYGKRATIDDVARSAGVSVSSVSRVVSHHPDVSDRMRKRVHHAIEQLNYTPDYAAQSLRSGSTKTIALLARDISNPIFSEIAKGAEAEARQSGYTIAILDSNEDSQIEAGNVLTMRRRRVDAYLVSFVDSKYPDTIEQLKSASAAVVMLDRTSPKSLPASEVLTDHYSGVRSAVNHLIEIGRAHDVAFIGGRKNSRATSERIRALQDGLAVANIPLRRELIRAESWNESYCREMALEIIHGEAGVSAIICGGTQSTVGVVSALSNVSRKDAPPIISCDMLSLLFSTPYPIGVVKRNSYTIGKLAIRLALESIQGLPEKTVIVPTFYCRRDEIETW